MNMRSTKHTSGAPEAYPWRRVLICLGAMLAFHMLAYFATRLLLPGLPVHRFALPLDASIPLVPGWVTVYLLAIPHWAACGVIGVGLQTKRRAYQIVAAYSLAMLLSGAMFLAWPLTMDRPEIIGDGPFEALLRWVYRADTPTNLCPSLHVLVSYFCWRGLWDCRRVPGWFRVFNLIFLILVCLSVVLVKQHLVIDIPVALALGEATTQAARLLRPEHIKNLPD